MIRDAFSKVRTLAWYLRRPPLYRELGRRVLSLRLTTQAVLEEQARQREEGAQWCARVAVPVEDVLRELAVQLPARTFAVEQPELLAEADASIGRCPVKMGGPASVDFLYHLTIELRPERVVETGVANGWSSLAILAGLRVLGQGSLTSVDMPYAKMGNDRWVGVAVPEHLRARWTLLRLPDRDGIPLALRAGPVDFAHYDSDKSVEGREYAYPALFRGLRRGGLLVSDDVGDNLAFRDFAQRMGLRPWVFRKPAGDYAGVLRAPW